MKQINIKLILAALVSFTSLTMLMSCEDDGAKEVQLAAPTITVTNPSELEVLVGGVLTFSISVEAEAGLSSVNLDGKSVKTYTGIETSDTFDYEYSSSENGSFNLVFSVEDAKGASTAATGVAVEVVGDLGFVIADFAGKEVGTTTLASLDDTYWDAARSIVSFNVTGNLAAKASHENVGSQFAVQTGADNPAADPALIFNGKAMKVVKQPADWGTDGWSHIILDFETTFDKAIIEALPQVNAEMTGLTAGTKVIQMDVYYDDTQDPNVNFADFKTKTGIYNADPTKGYLIDLSLVNNEVHRFNHDGGGYYIGYQGYVTGANVWQTVTFDALDLGRVSNFFAANNEASSSPASDNIDGVKLIPGGGYGDGQSPNALYFRNLRIVDVN
ncbi:MAG: hypothetical protein ACI83W_001163 [Marinoscillum sp.]|jgi:hypothetical protein